MLEKTEDEIENLQSRNQAKLETRYTTKTKKRKRQHNSEMSESKYCIRFRAGIEGIKPISC